MKFYKRVEFPKLLHHSHPASPHRPSSTQPTPKLWTYHSRCVSPPSSLPSSLAWPGRPPPPARPSPALPFSLKSAVSWLNSASLCALPRRALAPGPPAPYSARPALSSASARPMMAARLFLTLSSSTKS